MTENNRQLPLAAIEKFAVMKLIEQTPADRPDADIADAANKTLGLHRPIAAALVGNYRKSMGLRSIPLPTRAELRAELERARELVALAKQGRLDMTA